MGATRAANKVRVAQTEYELLEVGSRQVLLLGYLGQACRSGPEAAGELGHQTHPVLTLRGEGDGSGAVVDPGGQLVAPIVSVLRVARLRRRGPCLGNPGGLDRSQGPRP